MPLPLSLTAVIIFFTRTFEDKGGFLSQKTIYIAKNYSSNWFHTTYTSINFEPISQGIDPWVKNVYELFISVLSDEVEI